MRLIDADAINYIDLNRDVKNDIKVFVAFKEDVDALPTIEAVQGCDGCRHNTRIPQEHCLRCKRYWRDSYERKGGDDE